MKVFQNKKEVYKNEKDERTYTQVFVAYIKCMYACRTCGYGPGGGAEAAINSSLSYTNGTENLTGTIGTDFGSRFLQINFDGAKTAIDINDGTDLSSWCTNLPNGIRMEKNSLVNVGMHFMWVRFVGTPTETKTDPVKITIPPDVIRDDETGEIITTPTVIANPNNVVWNITDPIADEMAVWKTAHSGILGKDLSAVTENDMQAIQNALTAYNNLSQTAKNGLVTEKAKLDNMLVAAKADGQATTDANKWKNDYKEILAKDVNSITAADKGSIDNALNAYNSLSDAAKNKLTAEKAKLDNMLAVANADEQATAAADKWKNDHKEILAKDVNNITAADKESIDNALNAYNSLSDAAKAKVADEKKKLDDFKLKLEKELAKDAIDAAAEDAKKEIEAMGNLTKEEKEQKQAEVDTAADTAKKAIDNATTVNAVATAQGAGKTAIANVQTAADTLAKLNKAKSDAIAAVEKKADAAIAAINKMGDLSDTEKEDKIKEVEKAVTAANGAINSAEQIDDVTKAKGEGETAIANVQSAADALAQLNKAKSDAIAAVEKKADAAIAAINKMGDLSDKEKADKIKEVEDAVKAANDAINSAEEIAGVTKAKGDGEKAIEKVQSDAAALNKLNEEKRLAKAEVRDAADAAIEEINNLKDLPDTEKAKKIADVEDAVTAANTAIGQATDKDGVDKAVAAGKDTIAAVKFAAVKDDTKAAIAKDAAEKLVAINNLKNLSDEERANAANAILDAQNTANGAIDEAEDVAAVVSAKDTYDTEAALAVEKINAVNDINSYAEEKKAAIDALENLTDEEKDAMKAAVDTAADDAKAAINAVTDIKDVAAAKEAGITAIDLVETKAAAIDAVKAQETELINYINSLPNLSDKQKAELIEGEDGIKEWTETAIYMINNADDAEKVAACVTDYESYAAYEKDMAEAADFIAGYLTPDTETLYTSVNRNNVDQILSGKGVWDKLNDEQKEFINSIIESETKGVYKTYEDYLKAASDFAHKQADKFIKDYVSDKDGNIYKDATKDNYEQILSGKAEWDKMSQAEKDAINAKLKLNGGKTYEELLQLAQNMKNRIAAEKKEKEKIAKTGDQTPIALYALLAMISLAGAVSVERKRRYM